MPLYSASVAQTGFDGPTTRLVGHFHYAFAQQAALRGLEILETPHKWACESRFRSHGSTNKLVGPSRRAL